MEQFEAKLEFPTYKITSVVWENTKKDAEKKFKKRFPSAKIVCINKL